MAMFVAEPSVWTTWNTVDFNVAVNFSGEKELLSLTIHIFCEFSNFSRNESRGVFVDDV